MSKDNSNHTYLGDAVYAEFTSNAEIYLRLNDHRSRVLIVIDQSILKILNDFNERKLKELEMLYQDHEERLQAQADDELNEEQT